MGPKMLFYESQDLIHNFCQFPAIPGLDFGSSSLIQQAMDINLFFNQFSKWVREWESGWGRRGYLSWLLKKEKSLNVLRHGAGAIKDAEIGEGRDLGWTKR